MNRQMKNRYHVFLRPWGVYYCEDLVTKKQETLKTRDKDEAFRKEAILTGRVPRDLAL
jgi:hypothetical protein